MADALPGILAIFNNVAPDREGTEIGGYRLLCEITTSGPR